MTTKRRTNGKTEPSGERTIAGGRKSAFGTILRDDPYTAQIQRLLRQAKSKDEIEARVALLELFYRFHARLPLEEARLGRPLPWNREPSNN